MLIADVDDFGYRLFFLLHIVAILVAFAPAFVWPVVQARARRSGNPLGPEMGVVIRDGWNKIYGPALVAAGVFGLGLIGLGGDGNFEFSQTWVSIAFLLWFLMLAVVFGLLPWNERKAAEGDTEATQRTSMFTGILHVLLLLILIDMIWKPGY
ncbi:MAG: hypothetical protein WKF43_06450 [Acidimicrobiales bacterium]